MKKRKAGLIGCGTIGSGLASFLLRKCASQIELASLCDHSPEKAEALARRLRRSFRFETISELVDRCDLVIEAASADVSSQIADLCLKRGRDCLIMSTGGLLPKWRAYRSHMGGRGRLFIPSGAVAGVDGLLAARLSGLKRVRLVTRKPPSGLKAAPYFETRRFPTLHGREEKRLFAGNAFEAVRAFPQNVNVAAILSLAGLGPSRTRVEIWTSHAYERNSHEIEIVSLSGTIRTLIENVPSPLNPKTSALAVWSAQAALEKILSPVRVGT